MDAVHGQADREPIIISKDGTIWDGHHRAREALERGQDTIDAIVDPRIPLGYGHDVSIQDLPIR
jgi:hypothetical protein